MFNNITIKNFRGVRNANLEDLSQVNVFFGKNNCGKSSILESVFLLSGMSNPTLPFLLNHLRGYSGLSYKDLFLDFYNTDTKEIEIDNYGDDERHLVIKRFRKQVNDVSLQNMNGSKNTSGEEYGLTFDYRNGNSNEIYHSTARMPHPNSNEQSNISTVLDERYKEKIDAEYLPANYMQASLTDEFRSIVINKDDRQIVSILREIDPKIKRLVLVGNIIMVDVGLSQLLPLGVMGDGIRKMLSIIIKIHACKNGILCIDEIDNGFHYSAMESLWLSVFSAAKSCNTQLFITSHNIDSIKGLLKTAEKRDEFRKSLSIYKLVKTESDDVVSFFYDYSKATYMVQQEMEMR